MEHILNHIALCGTMASTPSFSHESHGRRFYQFMLAVERLSGTADVLRIVVSEALMEQTLPDCGGSIRVSGQVRSFNSRAEHTRRLIISVFAESIEICDCEPDNHVILTGSVCKPPVFRRTPLGREICDVMLAVNRPYRRADYLPCIFWGTTAREIAALEVGEVLTVEGRLQSREYIKLLEEGSEKRVAYEVSAVAAEVLHPREQTENEEFSDYDTDGIYR